MTFRNYIAEVYPGREIYVKSRLEKLSLRVTMPTTLVSIRPTQSAKRRGTATSKLVPVLSGYLGVSGHCLEHYSEMLKATRGAIDFLRMDGEPVDIGEAVMQQIAALEGIPVEKPLDPIRLQVGQNARITEGLIAGLTCTIIGIGSSKVQIEIDGVKATIGKGKLEAL